MKHKASRSRFRTDMIECMMDLLDFAEEKIKEAKAEPASRGAALSEAIGVIPIMKDRLCRECPELFAALVLLSVDEILKGIVMQLTSFSEDEFGRQIDDAYERCEKFRNCLCTHDVRA